MTRLENDAGTLIAERGLKLVADEANSSKGRIAANGSLHAKVGTLSQKGGELTSQDSLTLDLGILNNNAGRIAGNQGVEHHGPAGGQQRRRDCQPGRGGAEPH